MYGKDAKNKENDKFQFTESAAQILHRKKQRIAF